MSVKNGVRLLPVLVMAIVFSEILLVAEMFLGIGLWTGLLNPRLLSSVVALVLTPLLLARSGFRANPFGREYVPLVGASLGLWYILLALFGLVNGFAVNSYAPSIVIGILNIVIDAPHIVMAVLSLGLVFSNKARVLEKTMLGSLGLLVFADKFLEPRLLASLAARQAVLNTSLGLVSMFSLLAGVVVLLRRGASSLAISLALGMLAPFIASPILPHLPLALLSFLAIIPSLLVVLEASSRVELSRGGIVEKGSGSAIVATALLVFVFLLVLWRGYWPMIVLSGSMEPAIKTGDIIVVQKTNTEPKIGEIVAYKYSGMIIIHRVVNITGDEIVTKGDANKDSDKPIHRSQVLGKLYMHIPYAGVPLLELARMLGGSLFQAQILLLASIILAIMAPPLLRMARRSRRQHI